MRITFVLPTFAPRPSGGFKVVYEFANGLAGRGHRVTVVHPRHADRPLTARARLWSLIWPLALRVVARPLLPWFQIAPGVRMLLVPDLRPRYIPDADIVVAASWQAAEMVRSYPPTKGSQCYLVQDYEHWMTAPMAIRLRIEASFHAFSVRIAYSPAVVDMLARCGLTHDAYVPLAVDQRYFHVDLSPERRGVGTIGFPVRYEQFKGVQDAITAMGILHTRYPALASFHAFGSYAPVELPHWVEFHASPTDAELARFYNMVSIFVLPSHFEGWGLPGLEALACGAALVTTDSLGVRAYAKDQENALVVPIRQPSALASAVERLLLDDRLRQRLARQGSADAKQFSWDRSVDRFEQVLLQARQRDAIARRAR